MSTIPQLIELRRRKSDLAFKAARYGINTPPEIAIEKSDLENVIGLMERIDIHRQRIAVLIRQRDHFGQNAPPHIETEIATARSGRSQHCATSVPKCAIRLTSTVLMPTIPHRCPS